LLSRDKVYFYPIIFDFLFIGIFYLYIFFYPPFRSSSLPEFFFIFIRILLEFLVLSYLVYKNQVNNPGKINILLALAFILTSIFGYFSPEVLRNSISFFNKILFLFLFVNFLQHNYRLLLLYKKGWIFIWYFFSLAAIIAIIGKNLNLLSFSQYLYYDSYMYDYNPLVGSISYRGIGGYKIARYVGWMFEHGFLAYYFAINVIIATTISKSTKKYNSFKILNYIGGLLTFSVSFYLYFFISHIFSFFNKRFKVIIYVLIFTLLYLGYYIYKNPQSEFLLFTSLLDRIWRLDGSINILFNMNIMEILVGIGTFQARAELGGGIPIGVLSMLIGRGLLISMFYLFLIVKFTSHNKNLMIFTLYYSLIFGEIFLNPITIFITSIIYIYSKYESLKFEIN
jgi:hypothetical protein